MNFGLMTILLQAGEIAEPAAEKAKGGFMGGNLNFLLMMGLVIVVMYLFMIRPQQRKQKEMQKFREALDKGQKVVTAGGIYGVIKEVQGNMVLVEIDKNVAISIDKASIMRVIDTEAPQKK